MKISVFQNKTHQEIQIFPPAEQHFAWFKYEKEHPLKLHVLKTALWYMMKIEWLSTSVSDLSFGL